MASEVDICNRALQKLGAKRIVSLSQDSRNARSCSAAYTSVRDAELRSHPWSFAVKRVQLAAEATAPAFGKARAFTLPSDFLKLVEDYAPSRLSPHKERIIEGRSILTDEGAPLEIRYISKVPDPTLMDSLFVEALATRLAMELAEEITQSNTKKEDLQRMYVVAIREARKANAFERSSQELPEDTWITSRG